LLKQPDNQKSATRIVQEFFNLAFRRFEHPMNVAEAEQYLITVFRPLLAVHSSPALYVEAMRIAARYHLSWNDCIIVAAALQSQCSVLYARIFSTARRSKAC